MTDQQHRPGYGPVNVWQQNRPSPISDLLERHRAEMARIWERHRAELRNR